MWPNISGKRGATRAPMAPKPSIIACLDVGLNFGSVRMWLKNSSMVPVKPTLAMTAPISPWMRATSDSPIRCTSSGSIGVVVLNSTR